MRTRSLGLPIALLGVLFGGCFRSTGAISREEFLSMVHGSIESVGDVSKLFPKTVSDIEARKSLAIDLAKKEIAKILAISDRTFANTALAFDRAGRRFSIAASGIRTLKSVHTDKSLRDAAQAAVLELSKFSIDAFYNVDLYNAFKSYVDGNAKRENLDGERHRYLEESMKAFKRMGLHLPAERLKRVKSIQKELSALGLEFGKNTAEDKSSIMVEEKDLAGVDPNLIKNLKKNPEGRCVLTCDYPTYYGVVKHCKNHGVRRDFALAFSNRAYPANKSVLEKIIAKRDKLARELGFESFAQYDIDDTMAKTPERVEKFIKDMSSRVLEKERREFEMLTKELPEGVVLREGKFDTGDFAYTVEQYKKKNFNLDERKIAEYFPLEKTLNGVFEIYQNFLGLKFKFVNSDGL